MELTSLMVVLEELRLGLGLTGLLRTRWQSQQASSRHRLFSLALQRRFIEGGRMRAGVTRYLCEPIGWHGRAFTKLDDPCFDASS